MRISHERDCSVEPVRAAVTALKGLMPVMELVRFPLSVGTNGPPKTLVLAAGSILDYEGDAFVNAVRTALNAKHLHVHVSTMCRARAHIHAHRHAHRRPTRAAWAALASTRR